MRKAVGLVSLKELLIFCLPLIFSLFYENFTYLYDRILLSHYSTQAMNGVSCAFSLLSSLMYGLIGLTMVSQVFVAKYQAQDRKEKCGSASWQTLWCSLFSIPLLLALLGLSYWIPIFGSESSHEAELYFRMLLPVIPLIGVNASLSGFFIGIGQTKKAARFQFCGQMLYLLLDPLLIFGLPGIFPGLGVLGAALAYTAGQLLPFCLMLRAFLGKSNRLEFGTADWKFQAEELARCLKVGIPNAVATFVEAAGWAVLMLFMSRQSELHISVMTLFWTLSSFFSFVSEGMQRGITNLAAACIAKGRASHITSLIHSGRLILLAFSGAGLLLRIWNPGMVLSFFSALFFTEEASLISDEVVLQLFQCLMVYFFFEGIGWVMSGVLLGLEDTLSLLFFRSCHIWFAAVLPALLLQSYIEQDPMFLLYVSTVSSILFWALCSWRYRSRSRGLTEAIVIEVAPAQQIEAQPVGLAA